MTAFFTRLHIKSYNELLNYRNCGKVKSLVWWQLYLDSGKCKVVRERPSSREPTRAPLVFFILQQLSGLVSLTKRLEQPTTNLSSHYHQYVPVLITCELSRGSGLQISVSRLKPFVRSCARLTFLSLSSFGLLRRSERLSFIRANSGGVVCFFMENVVMRFE